MAFIGKNPKFNTSTYTPQSTEPSNPVTGMVYNDDGTNRDAGLYRYDGTNWVALGGGSNGINYLENFQNTSNWTVSDAVDLQVNENTINPQRGTSDLQILKVAAQDGENEYASYAFEIDRADRGSVLPIKADYITGTNVLDDDFELVIYDVTNAVEVNVINSHIKVSPSGSLSAKLNQVFFQASADSVNYELRITVRRNTTDALSLILDNMLIGPENVTSGSFISDWEEYTPTGSWTTNTTYQGFYKRVGSKAVYRILVSTSGVPSSGSLEINLAPGHTIDTDKLPAISPSAENTTLGFGGAANTGVRKYGISVAYASATSVFAQNTEPGTGGNAVNPTTPFSFNNGDTVDIYFEVPIQGWEVAASPSQIISNRSVIVSGKGNAGQSITANVTDIPFTEVEDNLNAFNGSVFTAPEDGEYLISGQVLATASAINGLFSYVDGSLDLLVGFEGNTSPVVQFNTIKSLNKGQTLSIRSETSITLDSSDPTKHSISIRRVNKLESVVYPSDTIALRASSDSGQVIPNAAFTTVVFEDVNYITSGSHNTSTGEYTVPITGKYIVSAQVMYSGAVSGGSLLSIRVNGSDVTFSTITNASSEELTGKIYDIIELQAGDIVDIQAFQSTGAGRSLNTSNPGLRNFFNVVKIGN
jgi:hypothetical protein